MDSRRVPLTRIASNDAIRPLPASGARWKKAMHRNQFKNHVTFLPCLSRAGKLSYLALASVFLRVMDLRRLLFLNGIKAFEAAARSGSFAAAGAELNVSAAAVSRMVHLLEERLGIPLFERKAHRPLTTAAGPAHQSGLTPVFAALASPTPPATEARNV